MRAIPGYTFPASLLNQCSTPIQIAAIMPAKHTVKEANNQIRVLVNVASSPNPKPSKSVQLTALTLQNRTTNRVKLFEGRILTSVLNNRYGTSNLKYKTVLKAYYGWKLLQKTYMKRPRVPTMPGTQ